MWFLDLLTRGCKSPFFHGAGLYRAQTDCVSQFNPRKCMFYFARLWRAQDTNLCKVANCVSQHSGCLDIHSSTDNTTWNHVSLLGPAKCCTWQVVELQYVTTTYLSLGSHLQFTSQLDSANQLGKFQN